MSMAEENEVKTKPQGKRKISIEKIEDKARKQVTFSKRRKGIFKKASELCTLCNAEIAVLTFSGAGKIFSFGHPSADEIINRYVNGSTPSSLGSSSDVNEHIRKEKLKDVTYSDHQDLFWWQKPVEGIGLEELEQYMTCLKELRNNVAYKIGNCWEKNVAASSNIHPSGLDLNKAYNPMSNEAEDNMSFKPKD